MTGTCVAPAGGEIEAWQLAEGRAGERMRREAIGICMALGVSGPALAQQGRPPQGTPAAQQAAAAKPALMAIVSDGIFELRQGQSVDLTKKEVLVTFTRQQVPAELEKGRIFLSIAGASRDLTVGNRFDLKTWSATQKAVSDKDKCFLDLIDVVAPKGAPPVATFRFSCN